MGDARAFLVVARMEFEAELNPDLPPEAGANLYLLTGVMGWSRILAELH
jgi:hypothetical protein